MKNYGRNRTLALVDVENLVGAPNLGPAGVREVVSAVHTECGIFGNSNLYPVVGCSHFNAGVVMFNWPGARVVLGSGPDGADLALIDVVKSENVAARFGRVVVASGDGIFAPVVADLQASGLEVEVLVGRGRIAHDLYCGCKDVRYLPLSPADFLEGAHV